MPYNPNIPMPSNKLRVSQNDILLNFQSIGTGFALNHVDLSLSGAGKHKLLTMPRQTFPQVVAGTDLLMYTGLNADTTLSEIYVKRSTDAGNGVAITAGATDNATFGWSTLPSGAKLKWGTFSFTGAVLQTVVMSGPAFTAIGSYSVTVSIDSATTTCTYLANNLTTNSFQFFSNVPAASTYRYIALGS